MPNGPPKQVPCAAVFSSAILTRAFWRRFEATLQACRERGKAHSFAFAFVLLEMRAAVRDQKIGAHLLGALDFVNHGGDGFLADRLVGRGEVDEKRVVNHERRQARLAPARAKIGAFVGVEGRGVPLTRRFREELEAVQAQLLGLFEGGRETFASGKMGAEEHGMQEEEGRGRGAEEKNGGAQKRNCISPPLSSAPLPLPSSSGSVLESARAG